MNITLPDPDAMSQKVQPYLHSEQFAATTQEQYLELAEKRAGAKKLLAEVADLYDPIQKAANSLVATIRESRRKFEIPLSLAIQRIDWALDLYEKREAIKRAEEEARIAEQIEAEAKKARETEVKAMAKTGFVREAERLAEQPIELPPVPILPDAVPKLDSLQKRTLWEAEVTDKMALIRAVAEGKAPLQCLEPNMACLNGMARAAKSTLHIPGVKAVSKTARAQLGGK